MKKLETKLNLPAGRIINQKSIPVDLKNFMHLCVELYNNNQKYVFPSVITTKDKEWVERDRFSAQFNHNRKDKAVLLDAELSRFMFIPDTKINIPVEMVEFFYGQLPFHDYRPAAVGGKPKIKIPNVCDLGEDACE